MVAMTRIKTTYRLEFGTETIPLIEADEAFDCENTFTNYLDGHKLAKAPLAFPQLNLLIGTLDPIGCKANSWTNHLKVLLAHGFHIQASTSVQNWELTKAYYPISYHIRMGVTETVHLGLFYRQTEQTVDEQFPAFCEAVDYPPGLMKELCYSNLESDHSVWGDDANSSALLVGTKAGIGIIGLDATLAYLGFPKFRTTG